MSIDFEVTETFPATQEEIFSAWLDSHEHTLMTGSPAKVTPGEHGSFTAWDGYIQGTFLKLDPPRSMHFLWRTSDFKESDVDSKVEVLFEPAGDSTKVTIRHTGLPEFGMVYKKGWIDFYFTPMLEYFKKRTE